MRFIKYSLLVLFFIGILSAQEKPVLCFTFDDGTSKNILSYEPDEINKMILTHLEKHKAQALFYVSCKQMDNENGKKVIQDWNDAGHLIANHTYNHRYYHSKKVSVEEFTKDIARCDRFLNKYPKYVKYFRAPYLKRGDTIEKREGLIKYLKENEYKNGYVTIDASDWYYNKKLIEYLKKDEKQNVEKIKKLYIEHIIERAGYYDSLAEKMFDRKIKHSLLLHHNLISALFLDDLINAFKNKGWDVIDAGEALKDEIYEKEMNVLPAGESIVWSIAKGKENYNKDLRYPAEDSRYEKIKFEEAGL